MDTLQDILFTPLVWVAGNVLDDVAICERDLVRDAVLSWLDLEILVVTPTNLNLSRFFYRLHSIVPLLFHIVFQTPPYTGDD